MDNDTQDQGLEEAEPEVLDEGETLTDELGPCCTGGSASART
jgi:hypothetical protein